LNSSILWIVEVDRRQEGHMTVGAIEYIRYRVPPDRCEAFAKAYAAAGAPLLASECCLGYDVARCVEEPDRFIVRIQWTSVDDHLRKFRTSSQFREFFTHVAPFVDQIEEMQHYASTLAG
jgi:quinol monooxygenase YgiN